MVELKLKEFLKENNLKLVRKRIEESRSFGFCRAIKLNSGFEESFHYDRVEGCWS